MTKNDPNDKTGLPPNPANDVYTVSTGIAPELNSQSEAEAVVALDPPEDQVPALGGDASPKAAEKAEKDRQERIEAAAKDDTNKPVKGTGG